MIGGMVVYFGPAPECADLRGAGLRAPWRGTLHEPIIVPGLGFLCAQGGAISGLRERLAIGFHGRIDNLPELATSLGLEPDDTLGVIAALYQKNGDEFAHHILGDYAINVMDPERQSLLAVRDWIGMRPMFWLNYGDHFSLATEIKQALALLKLPVRPAHEVLSAFKEDRDLDLTATFVEGVKAVPPCGQVLFCSQRPVRAWRRQLKFSPVKVDGRQAAEEIRRRLEVAVCRRLPKGRHAASMMSGGVDSPAVTAVAAYLGQQGAVQKLERCYTMALPEIPECDETELASQAASVFGIPWTPVVIKISDFRAWPARAFEVHDGPVYLTAAGVSHIMHRAEQDGIDTLLCGTGGDEFADQSGNELRQSVFRREWLTALNWVFYGGIRRLKGNTGIIARTLRDQVFKGQKAESKFEATASWFWTRYTLEIFEQEGALRGITIECPLLDFELASFLSGLPPSVKSTLQYTKFALREAVKGLVPDTVLFNPSVTVYNAVALAAMGQVPSTEKLHSFLNKKFADSWLEKLDYSVTNHAISKPQT